MQKSFYRYYSASIAAGETREFNVYARFIALLSWSGTTEAIVQIGDQPEETLPAGLQVSLPYDDEGKPVYFDKIRIRNANAGAVTVKFAVSAGLIGDSNLLLSGSTLEDILEQLSGLGTGTDEDFVAISNVEATLVIAANADRKSVMVQNLPTNTGLMYVGYTNTMTKTKCRALIAPGQIFSTSTHPGTLYLMADVNGEEVAVGEDV